MNSQRLDKRVSLELDINKKKVKYLLAKQLITVNGKVIKDADLIVNRFSKITIEENTLPYDCPCYLMLNKPKGVVSATKDDKHRTVIDLIDHPKREDLHIVGRLDLNSSGLVLLTNDSQWSESITNPLSKVEKHYIVTVEKPITSDYINAFANGIYFQFEDIVTLPVTLTIISSHKALVILNEGKYHQIKRMFGRFKNKVLSIHRISVGNIALDTQLGIGKWRILTDEEINNVKKKAF
ncbi:16S rRNA pseudouridine(516) synthase [Thalassotalea sediminis]|uniref:16S rRNA pseudouridine(516) synthase n=1 Tax=Thalassotalea sediminis TaxID=1759089 RepID=UPI002572BBB6|nr:pseudouridine synthase [Thalassotalea sediminis]